jgi:hypothetical protein
MDLRRVRGRYHYPFGTLVCLEVADFLRLLQDGRLTWPAASEGHAGDLVLVHDTRMDDACWVYESEEDLDLLIDHARMAVITLEPEPALTLADPAPLRELLPRAASEIRDELPEDRFEKLRFRMFREATGLLTTSPIRAAKRAIEQTGAFYDMAGVCHCGEPGCASSHVWIEDYTVLLLFEDRDTIALLPCRIAV